MTAGDVINEDGTAVLIETVVYKYNSPELMSHDSIRDAQSSCDYGEDQGLCSSIGVYVDGMPHSTGPFDWAPPGSPRDWQRAGGEMTVERMVEEYARAKRANDEHV